MLPVALAICAKPTKRSCAHLTERAPPDDFDDLEVLSPELHVLHQLRKGLGCKEESGINTSSTK